VFLVSVSADDSGPDSQLLANGGKIEPYTIIIITTSLCSEPTGMEFSLQLVYVVSQPGWNFHYTL
jgi:hypothetical protein